MFGKLFGRQTSTIEERLAVLRPFGIGLNPGRTVEEMLGSWGRDKHAADPSLLWVSLGGEVETGDAAGERFCDAIWHFDTECLEDHGDYIRIADRFRVLAGGGLPLTDIKDFVDVEQGQAWVSFRLDGREHRWDARVDNDWVDPTILSRFAKLLESRKNSKRFTYLDLGGQDCIIGCLRGADLPALRKTTGLDWKFLD